MTTPEILTPRLKLRQLTLADAPDVFAYARDPEVAAFTSWQPHQSLADAETYIRYEQDRYAANRVATWALEARASGRVIGCAGYVQESAANRRAEIGYVLARPAWGQGLMTEAVDAILAHAFGALGLHRVEAYCKAENLASARVMVKAGMKAEGVLRGYVWKDGRPRDVLMHSILAPEWRAK